MNAKKARKLRQQARKYTPHLPEVSYQDHVRVACLMPTESVRLGECTRGAYRALKSGAYRRVVE